MDSVIIIITFLHGIVAPRLPAAGQACRLLSTVPDIPNIRNTYMIVKSLQMYDTFRTNLFFGFSLHIYINSFILGWIRNGHVITNTFCELGIPCIFV